MLAAATVGAVEIHGAFTVAPQWLTENRDSPAYGLVDIPARLSRNDVELRVQEGGFNAQGILRQQVARVHLRRHI